MARGGSGRVEVEGLDELRKTLRRVGDAELPKELRKANKRAAEIVAKAAAAKVPVKTGRTRASVRALGSQRDAKVRAGGAKVPWYGFLDFGGKRPRDRVGRPRIKQGRYIYPALAEKRDEVADVYEREVRDLLRRHFN